MTTEEHRRAIIGAVDSAFDAQVEFTRQLLALPSLRGQEGAAQDALESRMRDLGLDIDRWTLDPGELAQHSGAGAVDVPYENTEVLVGTLAAADDGARSVILNGHIDVVPVGDTAQWARDPFEPVVDGDWLYGRGAGDMKAGLVANLFAVQALRSAGLRPAGRLHLQSVPEEESTGNGTLSALQRGYMADAVLISEPSGQDSLRSHVGVIWFALDVRSRAAHASEMQTGSNAIDVAWEIIGALRELEARWNERAAGSPTFGSVDHPVNLNVGTFHAGEWPSTVPDMCTVGMRISLVPEQDVEAAWTEIQECVAAAVSEDAKASAVQVSVRKHGFFSDGYTLPPGSEAEAVLGRSHEHVTGEPLREVAMPGYTDCRVYGLFADTPSLMYGPRGERLHAVDERVSLSSLREVTKTIALFVADWCGVRTLDSTEA